jgi:hypothetical protein
MSVTKTIEKNFMVPVLFNGMFFIVFGGTHDAHARHSCLSNRLCARLCRWIWRREQMSRQRYRRARERTGH